jgi:hypothetical protein
MTIPPAKKYNIAHQETLQPKNTHLSLCPGNVYLVHEHDKQRRKPARTPTPTPTPTPKTFLKKLNEGMPFFASCPFSPRLRMDPTKSNVHMHFEKIAIEVDPVGHELFQEVPTGIKAGDQSVTGKKIRETIMFLTKVQLV